MKHLLLSVIIMLMTLNICYSAPNFDPNLKVKTYDTTYNVALRNKLIAEYDKKYLTCNKAGDYCNYDLKNYHKEVTIPYYENAKNWQDTIIKN